MKYSAIKKADIANGEGVRVSLFVSGCRNYCKGCFNQDTWSFDAGMPYDQDTEKMILDRLGLSYINGLSLLGGDPFEPENLPAVTQLCKKAKELYPNKDIWCWTGYYFEMFRHKEIMNYLDVLVDGPFVEELKDITLTFRGSSNQRLIDVPASVEKGEIVVWDKLLTKTK